MNKHLLLSAAAAVCTSAGAATAQASTTIHLGSYCDYFVVHKTEKPFWVGQHMGAQSCSSQTYLLDPGIQSKVGKSKVVAFGEYDCRLGLNCGTDFWVFSYPFGPGGWWEIYGCSSGSTCTIWNSGQQTANAAPGATKTALADAIERMRRPQQ